MQHPDEGTIHAWLDGALPDDEARVVEEHLDGCPACQALVAEARGFTAAASRILAALDDVPVGVVPRGAPASSASRAWWRRPAIGLAATIAVVATGTVMVVTNDWGAARSPRSESVSPVIVSEPGAPSVSTAVAGAAREMDTTTREMRAVSVPETPRPAEGQQGRAGERPPAQAGTSNRQAAADRGVTRSAAPAPAAAARVSAKAETTVAEQRLADVRRAEEPAMAKAQAEQPQAAAVESIELRREGAARTRERVVMPATPSPAPRAGAAAAQTRDLVDASGCYALSASGAPDDIVASVPAILRLTIRVDERTAVAERAAPATADAALAGWRYGAGDSVIVRLPGDGATVRLAFPVVDSGTVMGFATRLNQAGTSGTSGPVVVRRTACSVP